MLSAIAVVAAFTAGYIIATLRSRRVLDRQLTFSRQLIAKYAR